MADQNHSVLMVGWEYPPHNSGGLGVACQGMTEALAQKGTKINFTLPYKTNPSDNHMSFQTFAQSNNLGNQPPFNAYCTSPKNSEPSVKDNRLTTLPGHTDLGQSVEQYAQDVLQYINKTSSEYDFIHAHDWMTFPAAVRLKQKLNTAFVAHVHSTEFDRDPVGSGNQHIKYLEKKGLEIADHIITVSSYTKQIIAKRYHIPDHKISVVHNGVEPYKKAKHTQGQFQTKRPIIAFMGRLTLQKGADHFIKLAQSVLSRVPEALFIVAGNGDQYTSLLLKNAQKQLSASLLFAGFVRGHERERLLERADVFVMPSLSEPFGLVALEAAQRETPVIVSKPTGVAEVLPSAFQIDFWDINQMSNVITELLENKRYKTRVIKNQLKDLKNINWSSSAKKIRKVYKNVFVGS